MILKNESDMLISKGRQSAGRQPPRVFAENFNQPGRGLIQRSRQIEQRAFPTAGRASNGNCRPGEHTQVDISKNGNDTGGRRKAPGNILHMKNKRHRSRLNPGKKSRGVSAKWILTAECGGIRIQHAMRLCASVEKPQLKFHERSGGKLRDGKIPVESTRGSVLLKTAGPAVLEGKFQRQEQHVD